MLQNYYLFFLPGLYCFVCVVSILLCEALWAACLYKRCYINKKMGLIFEELHSLITLAHLVKWRLDSCTSISVLLNSFSSFLMAAWTTHKHLFTLGLHLQHLFTGLLKHRLGLLCVCVNRPYLQLLAESTACLLSCRSPEPRQPPHSHWSGWGSSPPAAPPLWASGWAGGRKKGGVSVQSLCTNCTF